MTTSKPRETKPEGTPVPKAQAQAQVQKAATEEKTKAGNYFIANYPPFSFWKKDKAHELLERIEQPPAPDTPLGVYLHVPFCRKRCHFCYFRIYTGKNSSEIQTYLDGALHELELHAAKPIIGDRKPKVVYFGGGTPSYLSVRQLTELSEAMKAKLPWDEAEEITFECEPGTLSEPKLDFLRQMGVTRLSLGVEHFDQEILELNGRAHGAADIDRAWDHARKVDFPQINIDLIAGMMGETEEKWQDAVAKTIALEPESVTIYQMEIPFNTTIYQRMKDSGRDIAPVADWETKRRWVAEAFERLESAGYSINSTCTAVRDPKVTKFRYREMLFSGADLVSLGVASFGHLGGVHYQNEHDWDDYLSRLDKGELPIRRALTPTAEEHLVREFVLQFKLGSVDVDRFRERFGVDVDERFAGPLENLRRQGFLHNDGSRRVLSREALLRVDELMHDFFLPEHKDARYT